MTSAKEFYLLTVRFLDILQLSRILAASLLSQFFEGLGLFAMNFVSRCLNDGFTINGLGRLDRYGI